MTLKNAFSGTAGSIKIKSTEHYNDLGYDGSTITGVTVAARNLVHGVMTLKVAIIDDLADQILTFGTLPTNIQVEQHGITQANSSKHCSSRCRYNITTNWLL